MSNTPDDDRTREIGIDFGPLAQQLTDHEYPATNAELVDAYGESVLVLQNGEQTLQEIFESMETVSFNSAEDVRTTIFNNVDEQAIGPHRHSERKQTIRTNHSD